MMIIPPSLATLVATSQYLCTFTTHVDERLVTIYRHVRAFDRDDALDQVQSYITMEGFKVGEEIAVVPM